MSRARRSAFSAVKTEGGLLPDDLLEQVAALDPNLKGLTNTDYHLADHERIGDEVNRSWTKLLGYWHAYKEAVAEAPEGDTTNKLTRDRWLLPLFKELGYGQLPSGMSIEVDGKKLSVSHGWTNSPIHLLGCRVTLDKKQKGVRGAAQTSPHGLVQAFLNRSDDHLWGFVSNGYTLRLLRDHHSLTRQAYVEFDLQTIMDGELYSEFMLVWLVCHQSRVEGKKPEDCWLEKWFQQAREEGVRALDHLRDGVEAAITTFGVGFLKHKSNKALRAALKSGELDKQDYYRQLLRLVYRLIFIFVAEDRDALLDRKGEEKAKKRYERYYTTKRLRQLAGVRRGSLHRDLWENLRLVMRKLGRGCPELAIPALGSFLWSDEAMPWLDQAECDNEHLLAGLRNLCWLRHGKVRYPVNWKNIGADELGSVYESLLELLPMLEVDSARFGLGILAGSERKTSGSYYTPASLVESLLVTALDPVLSRAENSSNAEAAILSLRVCDPACGSGHFLVAAARRLAASLARVRSGDEETSPSETTKAIRDVVGQCLFGVDINPMAVELCKISLWLEAVEGGPPLSFLDSHILPGNSLLGVTPALAAGGIPNVAFKPLSGDDKDICRSLQKRNKDEQRGQLSLFQEVDGQRWAGLRSSANRIEAGDDSSLEAIEQKAASWSALLQSEDYQAARLAADSWCSAFLGVRASEADETVTVTEGVFRRFLAGGEGIPDGPRRAVRKTAQSHGLFHWHLAFPHVFEPSEDQDQGWSGGFDVVLGNPPWERLNISQKEWFAGRAPDISSARDAAARRAAIKRLETESPDLYRDWLTAHRHADAQSHFVRNSGLFPLCGKGDVNTYSVFAELNRSLASPTGRVGCIVPTGIATDATTQNFFRAIVEGRELASFYSFENEDLVFPGVHHAYKFALVTLVGRDTPAPEADLVFFARQAGQLLEEGMHFTLGAADFRLINPNTLTCPTFRTNQDAEITKRIYRQVPVLLRREPPEENPWSVQLRRMIHMSDDAALFSTRQRLDDEGWARAGNVFQKGADFQLPLFEAKMVHQFDSRFGTYEGQTARQANQGKLPEASDEQHADPTWCSFPRYWLPAARVEEKLQGLWESNWLLGWRDICRSTDQRTVIASVVPRVAVAGFHQIFLNSHTSRADCVLANLCAFVLDYVARQKIGGTHLTYGVLEQLPVIAPVTYEQRCGWNLSNTIGDWIGQRSLELAYTAWDLSEFARDMGCEGPPFRWNAERRAQLRAELDAAFFHLYGVGRKDAEHILDSFWVVRNRDQRVWGNYRTKIQILDIYDRMQEAIDTGKPYRTLLDPPPADPRVAHPPRPRAGAKTLSDDELDRKIALVAPAVREAMRLRPDCPAPASLGLRELDPEVAGHVSGCEHCQGARRQILEFRNTLWGSR